jgi:hypothetical protein
VTSSPSRPAPQVATPGPWHVEDPLGSGILSIVAGGPEVYDWLHVAQLTVDVEPDEMSDEEVIPEAQVWANARLIAASPELVAAAADVLSYRVEGSTRGYLRDNDGSRKALSRLATALALAQGAAPAGGANPEEKL